MSLYRQILRAVMREAHAKGCRPLCPHTRAGVRYAGPRYLLPG